SATELGTSCRAQAKTECFEGKVYWVDSCGNRENVYSSNKGKSWNSGKILEADSVCKANSGSDCGNCDSTQGMKCFKYDKSLGVAKPRYGDYVCKKNTCVDNQGNERLNGESWCVYDGLIGAGSDAVGSRHFKQVCANGETKTEPCADFREELCGQIDSNFGGKPYSYAVCTPNRWRDCISQFDPTSCLDTN
ncbi:MAG: hypothetical protein AABX51_08545, partial [Nanoarchaeota archaeon]